MPSIDEIKNILLSYSPEIDRDLLDYTIGYFTDSSSDISPEAINEFLSPIIDHTDITQLCLLLSNINTSNSNNNTCEKPLTLATARIMSDLTSETLAFTQNKVTDIRHGGTKQVKSQVDQRKLAKAENKLAEKRAMRGNVDESIPEWNPDVKPAIIVNQAKTSSNGESRSKDIKLENFDIAFAGKPILVNADMQLLFGGRYGLVGKNGVGKSTLLRAMAHKELFIAPHIKILHVEQEASGDETTALQSVLDADIEAQSLIKEEKALQAKLGKQNLTTQDANDLNARLKQVYQLLGDLEVDKAESRASSILVGLGFSSAQQQQMTTTFSGGWRMRLALARALFCKPDLLLADEVTNYLDFPAVVWLENYFQNWGTTLLVVSHDKSFLDAVSTDILHLHDGQLDHYRGNFTQFVHSRNEKRKNQLREYESQLQYRQHLQAFIDRWRFNAKRAPQAQSKIKILEKLGPLIEPAKDDMEGMGEGQDNVYFKFPEPESLSPPILQADQTTFGYTSDRIILSDVSFDLRMDSKIAIVGPNGAGKSTLIKLLTGAVEPQAGRIYRHGRLRVALFSQHHVDQLELGQSSVQFLSSQFPGHLEVDIRRILGRFGLTGTTALQPIGTLSGGQKSRTVFAWMSMKNPHILVLDEPTNHLDMDSIDALSKALIAFKGGVLIVSHDQMFLDTVCQEIWVCDQNKLTKFVGKEGNQEGIVLQYKRSLLE